MRHFNRISQDCCEGNQDVSHSLSVCLSLSESRSLDSMGIWMTSGENNVLDVMNGGMAEEMRSLSASPVVKKR